MKKILLYTFLIFSLSIQAQTTSNTIEIENHSHNVKVATTFETQEHTQRVIVHNTGTWSQLYILYRYKTGDMFWTSIGIVTVPGMTKGIFYVEEGYNYGFEIEGVQPQSLSGKGKKFKVKNRDRKPQY